jgi:hypothetical protein
MYNLLFKIIKPFFTWCYLHEIYTKKPYITKVDNKLKINKGYKNYKQMNRKIFTDNSL